MLRADHQPQRAQAASDELLWTKTPPSLKCPGTPPRYLTRTLELQVSSSRSLWVSQQPMPGLDDLILQSNCPKTGWCSLRVFATQHVSFAPSERHRQAIPIDCAAAPRDVRTIVQEPPEPCGCRRVLTSTHAFPRTRSTFAPSSPFDSVSLAIRQSETQILSSASFFSVQNNATTDVFSEPVRPWFDSNERGFITNLHVAAGDLE
ncbi:uncharacterized protein IWZ02DRAFT_240827 [Phyllosticta citriasiana]|uniref:uncharacterized protein n=1 Tax=Phyllosticta citriasiana TaxID=595635 RepID=UPI0030FD5545